MLIHGILMVGGGTQQPNALILPAFGECDQGMRRLLVRADGTGPIVIAGYRQSLTDSADFRGCALRRRHVSITSRSHRFRVMYQRFGVTELVPREPRWLN